MSVLRTPDSRFVDLPDWPYRPRYLELADGLRMHYIDEGPPQAPPVLMLHGEPSWSYLYRHVIRIVTAAGLRAIAPDLIGFGRSDKLPRREDYTYARHIAWTQEAVAQLGLTEVTLLCQDWGGLIGLRLVAAEPERYARVVCANTMMPTGDQPLGKAFFRWRTFAQETPTFDIGAIVAKGCARPVAAEVVAAYDAPFPDESYKAGARQFPTLVPAAPDDPEAAPNRAAWEVLRRFKKPVLTLWSDSDPITRGADLLLRALIPGTAGQAHRIVEQTGHFIQEDAGEEIGRAVVAFVGG